MKYVLKTAAFLGLLLTVATGVSAESLSIIAPPKGTVTVVDAGSGADDYSLVLPPEAKGISTTKKGSLFLLDTAPAEGAVLKSADGEVELSIKESVSADFDTTVSEYITANTACEESGNIYAAANEKNNLLIDLSSAGAEAGGITLEFDMLLDKAARTNLVTLCDDNMSRIFDIQLRFRYDDAVYVAYQRDKYNYTPQRTSLLPVNRWVHIVVSIDAKNKKISLNCDGEVVFENKDFIKNTAPSYLKIGTGADNISVYTGKVLRDAQLQINTDVLALSSNSDFVSAPLSASVKLFESFEEIEPKYLGWEIEGNGICSLSSDGVLTAYTPSLGTARTFSVTSSINIGTKLVTAQKNIEISANGSEGCTPTKGAVIAGISKTSDISAGENICVKTIYYNPAAQEKTYYTVVSLYEQNGKNVQNYVYRDVCAAAAGKIEKTRDISVETGAGLSARIYVFNDDFSVNVLK